MRRLRVSRILGSLQILREVAVLLGSPQRAGSNPAISRIYTLLDNC